MVRGEIRAVGKVGGDAMARNVELVRGVHEAIAGRIFGMLGNVAAPVRRSHDEIARAVYSAVAGVHRVVPLAVASGAALAGREPSSGAQLVGGQKVARISDSRVGSFALGVLNGIRGDSLAGEGNELALPMTFRHGEDDLTFTRRQLESAFPRASTKVAVFVHGLCETDRSWFGSRRASQDTATTTAYGQQLHSDLGITPLYLRYNTGLHVSDNGRDLAQMLTRVVDAWPRRVEEIVLVGHSMGGLVLRSACHQASQQDEPWVDLVRHVFCLGTPHLGSHVEQGANVVGWALARLPETRPFAKVLNSRSAGIKDMRFGSLSESDWSGRDPDAFLENRCEEVPFLPGADYYFIGVTVTRDARHPLGVMFGDLLVRFASASGNGRRRVLPFEIEKGRHVGGLHHFHLLTHPAVYEQIRTWLDRETSNEVTDEVWRR